MAIVDDHVDIRENLAALVNGADGFECIATYVSAEEALAGVPTNLPDVVLMDINLPKMSGIDCVRRLKSAAPSVPTLMLTVYEDGDQLFRSLMAGASGYLVKRTPPQTLLHAIQEVHSGGSPMSRQIARQVVQYFHALDQKPPNSASLEKLTPRELEVLESLSKGHRYKEIAYLFNISMDTVRGHLRNIYDKLHVHSRTEAVVKFLEGK